MRGLMELGLHVAILEGGMYLLSDSDKSYPFYCPQGAQVDEATEPE